MGRKMAFPAEAKTNGRAHQAQIIDSKTSVENAMSESPQDRKVRNVDNHVSHPRLTYRVLPSFDKSQQLEIEMNWNITADSYKAYVIYRMGHREKLIPRE